MPEPLSDMQRGKLALIYGAELGAQRENAANASRGRWKRVPEALLARPDRTLYGLERRGLVSKHEPRFSTVAIGELAWTLTEAGRRALNV